MHTVCLARQAMATRFEIVLHGDNPVGLRAAGEEALDEIDRVEARLSLYRATSEIARVNARAAHEPVRVSVATFRLLEIARGLSALTEGAFDITIGPLMRCWGFVRGTGQVPAESEIADARACVGMDLVTLDSGGFTVRFAREGVMLDLGAIGKGHAVDVAAAVLREAGVRSALVHGGTSSVIAIGRPPDQEGWNVAIERPPAAVPSAEKADLAGTPPVGSKELIAVWPLQDEAMSVSAVWGKAFQSTGKTFGHVLDPRSGRPVMGAMLSAVALPSGTESDALSTALLTLGAAGLAGLSALRPGSRLLVVEEGGDGGVRVEQRGTINPGGGGGGER